MKTSDYVELHAHTAYSFLDGASQPEELLSAAAELGYSHMAITEHDNLCSALEVVNAASAVGIRALTGAELTVESPSGARSHVTLIVRTARGYSNLCRLITLAHSPRDDAVSIARPQILRVSSEERIPGRVPRQSVRLKGSSERPDPCLSIEQICQYSEGLILLTGCASSGLLLPAILAGRPLEAVTLLEKLHSAFARDSLFVELQIPQHRGDKALLRELRRIAELAKVGVVASGNVHAHSVARGRLHEVLVAIRKNTTLEACEADRDGNLARVLRSPEEMMRRFAEYPDAIANTRRIAESIEFDLRSGVGYRYPDLADSSGEDADAQLARIARAELEIRYAGRASLAKARTRLEEELSIIRTHKLSGFFLLHRDVLELAREVAHDVRGADSYRSLNPPGRGRGSSVESIVCYLTGLSHVDPVESGLAVGRFLNEEMVSVPDIDLDFPRDIRHELLARIVSRYGERNCAMVAAHATYRAKGAIRDVGRALGLPSAELNRIATRTDTYSVGGIEDALDESHKGARWDSFRWLVKEIGGLPRVMGQHSGGVVISTDPLDEIVPLQPAATPNRQLAQWDKDSCSDAGFLKIDVLGLGMLSAVEECVETISKSEGKAIDLSRISLSDKAVFAEIEAGDTIGTFQIESRAQIQSLRRVRPRNLDDLIVQVALIRPGPIIGKSVNPYIATREKLRRDPSAEIEYDHPLLEPVLRDTFGAIIFQDQVIEVSMRFAGFSAGDADGLRRAMTRKRASGSVELWRPRFIEGAKAQGVEAEVANRVFDKVIGFSHYGFPRAHSVAFALLAYQSAWLRHYYPAHFHTALINAEPMGFYPADSLLRDAKRRGVETLPIDVNRSDYLCTVEPFDEQNAARLSFGRRPSGYSLPPAIRIGLGCLRGVSKDTLRSVQKQREDGGEYTSIEDLVRRVSFIKGDLDRLVMAGACDCFELPRRELLWKSGMVSKPMQLADAEQQVIDAAVPEAPKLKQMSLWDEVRLDYRTQGLSVRAHPIEFLRPLVSAHVSSIDSALRASNRSEVDVLGVVVARQRPPTAKGMVFILLEDESGQINVVVAPDLYARARVIIRGEAILRIVGRIERHERVINLIASDVQQLPAKLRRRSLGKLRTKSWS